MKTPRSILARSFLAVLLCNALSLSLAAAPVKEEVLIDFTEVRRESNGSITKCYEWASGDWEKHLNDLPRRGCLIQAPSGKGNLGENNTMLEFTSSNLAVLVFVIGNGNNAKSINFNLEDRDGTEQSWNIALEGLEKGQTCFYPLDMTKSTSEKKPGKKPGMNLKKIASWNISGDWSASNVEILLVKMVAPKS